MKTNRCFDDAGMAVLGVLSLLVFVGCVSDEVEQGDPVPRREEPVAFYLGGIQINEADHQQWFDNLENQAMNTVQVTDYAMQGDWDSDHLWWDEDKPWAVEEIRGARRRGLSVVFVCRVAIDHSFERNEFLWHGMILPSSEELLESWFRKYTEFVLHWAEIAEREGVDIFMIGSEMNALATTRPATRPPALEEYFLDQDKQADRRRQVLAREEMIAGHHLNLPERRGYATVEEYIDARIATESEWARSAAAGSDGLSLELINARRSRLQELWQELIAKVRAVFRGEIGYAANFDQYHEVGFWHDLDIMGINAYFELRNRVFTSEDETVLFPELLAGWRSVLAGIENVRREQELDDLPVVFTEMGFTRRAKSTIRPWADDGFSLIYQSRGESDADDSSEDLEEIVVVWRDEPLRPEERAWAVRALYTAHAELPSPLLGGILYWKLSSHDYHAEHEAFMVHIGEGADDPILPELRRFVEPRVN